MPVSLAGMENSLKLSCFCTQVLVCPNEVPFQSTFPSQVCTSSPHGAAGLPRMHLFSVDHLSPSFQPLSHADSNLPDAHTSGPPCLFREQ